MFDTIPMASSSSYSPLAGSSQPNYATYDVFLSFRGEDTRYSFTNHLYLALVRSGLRTFRDDNEIDRGQELKPEIERAIIESRASIVVLSENYANSRWCLEELVLILEQRRNFNHFVLPVFYHVDPSDVRNQRRSFTIEGSKWTEETVNRWKAALTEVSNLTGMVLSGPETDFIAKVVDKIDYKLDLKLVSTPARRTGMETRAEVINSWLQNVQSDANALTIFGMGGSGKTTLAQYIYNSNKQNFESSSFIEDIGKHCKQPYGLIGLQKQLLGDVLGGKNVMISSVSEGTRKIENALKMKRVFLVLDDIDDQDQLSTLLGTKEFHAHSKIIITTRLLDIHGWFRSISRRCQMYELELLNDEESLELLSWHAFGSETPMEGFKELAVQLAQYCGGNPLALKVLGSSLFVGDEDPWTRNSMMEIWRSRMNSLNSLKGDLDSKIQGVLQKSFDSLPLTSHKELFLHIACFFVGKYKYDIVTILEDDLYAKSGIVTLVNRCLLTLEPPNGKLVMHQLIQDMGRKIVSEESKDPAKRSRVWDDDESYHLLRKGYGSKTIEGRSLNMLTDERRVRSEESALKTDSLVKMDKLKLLHLIYVKLTGSFENFPELRWLCWHWCNLKKIPSGLLMSSLVVIDMRYGEMEKFDPPTVFHSLKILDLEACNNLVSICSLHRFPKLETLILRYCSSLIHVCESIAGLESLALLDLSGCSKLWKASWNEKYVNHMEKGKALHIGRVIKKALHIGRAIQKPELFFLPRSLKALLLTDCEIEYNNDVCPVFHAQSFVYIRLEGNPFEYLPNNIQLNLIRALDLTSCPNLKSLVCLPSTLEELYTDWCTSLETITFQSAHFRLKMFGYEGCFKLSEIQGLFKLVPIAKIDEADLGHMQWITAYQDNKVDLVGDVITEGRIWKIQVLFEYGIRSSYIQGIKNQSMKTEYMSSSSVLSFHVPVHPKKQRIQGLHLSCLYRSLGQDKNLWTLLMKVSNITKGLTWIYNPAVYCKPKVDKDVLWLSDWPIGNVLDVGDEVNVSIFVEEGLIVSGCGASLVYMNDGNIKQEEKLENSSKGEEVIGGDLSEFEVTAGGYYLCRRDFFKSTTSYWLSVLFGHSVNYAESQGWRKSRQSTHFEEVYMEPIPFNHPIRAEIVLGVGFNSESKIDKMVKVLYSLVGVESISINEEMGRLKVLGYVDPEEVATRVREFEQYVVILSVMYDKIQ